jgi:hypothetical protein
MNWYKFFACMFIFSFFLSCITMNTQAANGDKIVTLPDFSVQINGQTIDNSHMMYPLFVYKDIAYLPLTWDNIHALGINLNWDDEKGLNIRPGGESRMGGFIGWKKEKFHQDLSGFNDPKQALKASMPNFSVTINDSYIDNWHEDYPLLEFNDVTYLPLTWTYIHDMLQLDIRWDATQGLNIIGGQQQVLGQIYYDDADYLYFYPTLITEKWQAGLKVKKTLDETPEWMTQEQTEEIRARIIQLQQQYEAESVSLDSKDDGLYYLGTKLLPKEEMTVDSTTTGNPRIMELKGMLFHLNHSRTLLSVTKNIGYDGGHNQYEYHTFLISNGQATEIKEFPQIPDRIIANPDGSYWLASKGVDIMHGHIMGGSRKLALIDTDGRIILANSKLDESDIVVAGLTTPGLTNPLTDDGKLLIYVNGTTNDGSFIPKENTSGYYWVDTHFKASRVSGLDDLVKQVPYFLHNQEQAIYLGSDRKFYLLQNKNNTIMNFTENKTDMWYDYQLLETE